MSDNPLAALAMRERAAKACDDCEEEIRALPTTFTDAELLAAAMQLPEVRALVEAAKWLEVWDASRRYPVPYRIRDPLRAALAPFIKGGE